MTEYQGFTGRCQGYDRDHFLTQMALPVHHAPFLTLSSSVHSILRNLLHIEASGCVGSIWASYLCCSPLLILRKLDAYQVQELSFEPRLLLFRSLVLSLDVSLSSGSWPHPEPQFLHLGFCTKVLKIVLGPSLF